MLFACTWNGFKRCFAIDTHTLISTMATIRHRGADDMDDGPANATFPPYFIGIIIGHRINNSNAVWSRSKGLIQPKDGQQPT